ncbi:MAG: hypothetical protein RL077_2817 [Verrucomicrobiota bacterium]
MGFPTVGNAFFALTHSGTKKAAPPAGAASFKIFQRNRDQKLSLIAAFTCQRDCRGSLVVIGALTLLNVL